MNLQNRKDSFEETKDAPYFSKKARSILIQKKNGTLSDAVFWWARRDLNPHVRSEH